MKKPRLWISNRNGNVFTICASDHYISQLIRTYRGGVRVKRLAASEWCAWAIGHNHRVYIFILPSDVPIRVPQTTYENQRWSPFTGFRSSNLLPTDRRAWSDEHGDIYLPKESIRLPSAHWDWEGDWFIDENLQGDICTDRGVRAEGVQGEMCVTQELSNTGAEGEVWPLIILMSNLA